MESVGIGGMLRHVDSDVLKPLFFEAVHHAAPYAYLVNLHYLRTVLARYAPR